MPELPEVETVRRGLARHVVGCRVQRVTISEPRLRFPVPRRLAPRVTGCRILAAERRAKYLILPLDSGDRLLIHLGMTGRLCVLPARQPRGKHDHVDFELRDAQGHLRLLRLRDPRRFGAVLLWPATQPHHPLLEALGPEPFDPAFDADYLFARARARRLAIKNFIMDGRVVVGVGNIYATEALFRAGVRPTRAAGRVTRAEYVRLVECLRAVLRDALAQGGTTLRDFVGAEGQAGYFRIRLDAYGRHGQPCRVCGTEIRRVVVGQRSSFYCPHCQS
jgi:formamidopyrimidine-DNA glycosylase